MHKSSVWCTGKHPCKDTALAIPTTPRLIKQQYTCSVSTKRNSSLFDEAGHTQLNQCLISACNTTHADYYHYFQFITVISYYIQSTVLTILRLVQHTSQICDRACANQIFNIIQEAIYDNTHTSIRPL